jgi:integrase/recombinase XerD
MPNPELALDDLADSWALALRAENKSTGTITTYRRGLKAYQDWCAGADQQPRLGRTQVRTFLAEFLDRGGQPTTAGNYLTALRSFAEWCIAEDELESNEVAGISFPRAGKKLMPPLSAEEMAGMLATCDQRTFLGKRDTAVLQFMVDCGGRAQEILGVRLPDISLPKGRVLIRGKGDKERLVAFAVPTATAIDRYLRARRKHVLAASTDLLWLGDRGQMFTYAALWPMVKKRAALAGVEDVHPHRFRRTFADNWLSAGGSTDGLMALAGWEDMSMIKRYAGARANVRGLEEHQRLFGGS